MTQLCDQEIRLAADRARAGFEHLLPIPVVRLLEQTRLHRGGAREPACPLGERLAVETRADEHGLDTLSCRDTRGIGHGTGRPDLEAGTTSLEGPDRDRALGRVAISQKTRRRGAYFRRGHVFGWLS
jgi:hypothetical protein